MASKIRIKAGFVEVDFEGSEEFMKEEIPALIKLLCSFEPIEGESDYNEAEELEPSSDKTKQTLDLATNSIAAKLEVKSARDLAIAACAHLTFVKGIDTFTRKNILAEMQLASNYYKDSHSKNLSNTLKSIVASGKLLEKSVGNYALHATLKSELETKLGG